MKKGKYINFLSIKSPQAEPLSANEIAEFKSQLTPIFTQLQNVKIQSTETPEIASNQSDFSRFTEATN
jgi:hypothetical protein